MLKQAIQGYMSIDDNLTKNIYTEVRNFGLERGVDYDPAVIDMVTEKLKRDKLKKMLSKDKSLIDMSVKQRLFGDSLGLPPGIYRDIFKILEPIPTTEKDIENAIGKSMITK